MYPIDVVEVDDGDFVYMEREETSECVYTEWGHIDPALRDSISALACEIEEKGNKLRELILKVQPTQA